MPSARMVSLAPEEDNHPNSTEQSSREDSDSGESYVAIKEQPISTVEDGVSEVNLKVVLMVAHVTEDMMGKCFHCGQGGHCWRDPECPRMTQTIFLNWQGEPAGSKKAEQVPNNSQSQVQAKGMNQANSW